MTGSWPRSTPAAASAPCGCGWGLVSSRRTGASSRAGNAKPWSWGGGAVAADRAQDGGVAADPKPAATLALLQDWWTAWQQAKQDPAQEVIVLAARRAEVDRLNTLCQELLAARGRLGGERLQVEDRQLAVGDRVVCGHNAIAELGVANGSRGVVTALDPQARTLTFGWTAPTAGRSSCRGPIWMAAAGASATAGWIWPMPPPATAPRD
jgi:hypothetical protein